MNRVVVFSVAPVLSVVSLLFCAAEASAQSKWTLTTADFRSRQVDLVALDETGAKVSEGSGVQTVSWDALLLLERKAAEQPSPPGGAGAAAAKFVLHLAGGDQLRGEPVKLDGETLQWQSPGVGVMSVPLREVRSVVRASRSQPASDEPRTEDVVQLVNGDAVRGILSDITAETITMQSGGNAVPVPLDSVSAVLLASTADAAGTSSNAHRAFRVRLADGSVVTAPSLKTAGETLVLTLPAGGSRELPLASIHGIEQLNGPVSWLSSRPPSENVQTPLLETARPARMDRTVTGKPIRFSERTFTRGIGVAPRSRITWPLGDGTKEYTAFRTQYAVDGQGPYANVTVRVLLDGRTVHEKRNVVAGLLSPVVIVPLPADAKSLTLEVDFGENYAVQDRLNWIEPALVKSSAIPPAPAPAPAPPQPSTTTRNAASAPAPAG